jgi:hypothetical protein
MNSVINENIDKGGKKTKDEVLNHVRELYNGLGYFDKYSGSVITFLLLTLFVLFVYTLSRVLLIKTEIADDWVNQRCNPKYIPFAGFINKPEGKGIMEYTNENFNYCVQNTTTSTTGAFVSPINSLTDTLTSSFNNLKNSVQNIREFINKFRDRIRNIAEDIFGRILTVMIPLQKIIIALLDSLNKTQGILTASLYTMFGSYQTLQSFSGAILELIIKMLVALTIVVMGLWAVPFTFPAASAMTAVFLAISIPTSLIIAFMTEVLGISVSGMPKLKSCFDENVLLPMNDGTNKKIKEIKPGDYLENNVKVTSTFKVTSNGLKIYNLNDIIVSENHIVKYYNIWLPVEDHPNAKLIKYNKPYLYCLNTTSKEIIINNTLFTDWDEIYGDNLEKVINSIPQNIFVNSKKEKKENIHNYLETGFKKNSIVNLENNKTKQIKDISIGDKLSNGGTVYGIVEIEPLEKWININNINNINYLGVFYHLLSTNGELEIDNKMIKDYNYNIDFITKKKNII